MKHILLITSLIFNAVFAQAELKRIIVDLDYKMIKGSSSSSSMKNKGSSSHKKVNVFMPDLNDELSAGKDSDVTCMTHTGSKLIVSPKQQSARIDTALGDALNYLIISSGESKSGRNEIQSKYALDDGRKIVMTFPDGSTDGQGYYVRNSGDISPSFPCSKN